MIPNRLVQVLCEEPLKRNIRVGKPDVAMVNVWIVHYRHV